MSEETPRTSEDGLLPPTFPDGGLIAWTQVFVGFVNHFVVLGVVNSFGVYAEEYVRTDKFGGISTASITLIGTLSVGINVLCGAFTGPLAEKIGYQTMSYLGAVLVTVALVAASFSTQYWQFVLFQGFLWGFGTACAFFPALAVIAHWFDKKRGVATGIAAAGAGVGGLVTGPLIQYMIDEYGVDVSLRVTGIGAGLLLTLCASLTRTRLKVDKSSNLNVLKLFTDSKFVRLFMGVLLSAIGYYAPFFFMSLFATQNGMTTREGAILTGAISAASAVGRIGIGFSADHLGHVNMLAACLIATSLSVALIWPFATSFSMLMTFALVYGVVSGGYINLVATSTADVFGTRNIGTMVGVVWSGAAPGELTGPLIGAFLIDKFTTIENGSTIINFTPAIMSCAGIFLVAGLVVLSLSIDTAKAKKRQSEVQ